MVGSIIILIAFYWLLRETDYMRIRLPYGGSVDNWTDDYGWDIGYWDYEFTNDELWDNGYQEYLYNRTAPKLVYGGIPGIAYTDNPQDKWLKVEADLTMRRNGEALYQRG